MGVDGWQVLKMAGGGLYVGLCGIGIVLYAAAWALMPCGNRARFVAVGGTSFPIE